MAFSQTAVSSLNDLTFQIAAFAVANAGFTDHGTITLAGGDYNSAGGQLMRRISKGGVYWSFFAVVGSAEVLDLNFVLGFMSLSLPTDYPATASPNSFRTYGGPINNSRMSAWSFAGPYSGLYMFTEGSCVHAVIELSSGIYNHISFGNITKTDTFVGGEYLHMGSYSQATYDSPTGTYKPMNVDGSGNTGMWFGSPITSSNPLPIFSQSGAAGKNYIRNQGAVVYNDRRDFAIFASGLEEGQAASGSTRGFLLDTLLRDTPNAANLRTVMFPQYIFIRETASETYKIAGYVPGVKVVSLETLSEKEIVYTDWQVFPLTQKNGSNQFASNSKNLGLAYQRVA